MRSPEFMAGMTAGLVWLSDVFESHEKALVHRKLLHERDVRLITRIIDACIRRRETLSDVGPKNMDLFVRKDGTVELKERRV